MMHFAHRVIIARRSKNDAFGSIGLSNQCSFGQRATIIHIGFDYHVGRFGEMLQIIVVAYLFIGDEEIEGQSFAIGYFSKIDVEVIQFVVGESRLERTRDHDCCMRDSQEKQSKEKLLEHCGCRGLLYNYKDDMVMMVSLVYNPQLPLTMDILINTLLRPYRSTYTLNDLGHKTTHKYVRTDECILNDRDQTIRYSYFHNKNKSNTCVVYCHCNSGSRVEGMAYVEQFIERGWNICLFDFTGSGQSEGEFISLGYYESHDLDVIIKRVRQLGNSSVLLWGRSMGAATIIFYLSQAKYRDQIAGCILDSPYASLWELVKKFGADRSIIPGFIIEHLLDYMRTKIKEYYYFDIKQLQPLKCVGNIDTPLLFITSSIDEFVRSEDVVELYKYAGSKYKQLEYIDKGHNSNRDASTIQLAVSFLSKCLLDRQKKSRLIQVGRKNNRHINGGNMAQMIIKAEKERNKIKRMKSEIHLNRSFKQNGSKYMNVHLKTESTSNPSVMLGKQSKIESNVAAKKQAIKFSLAHMEIKKKSGSLLDSVLM